MLASSTNCIICDKVVSFPTLVACILKDPFLLIVPETTVSPIFFSIGILSPVILDWSTEEDPSIITPSTPMLSPGFTSIISPFKTSSMFIIISSFSRNTVSFFGAKFTNLLIASLVLPFDFVSKYFPTVINVNIIPADSK